MKFLESHMPEFECRPITLSRMNMYAWKKTSFETAAAKRSSDATCRMACRTLSWLFKVTVLGLKFLRIICSQQSHEDSLATLKSSDLFFARCVRWGFCPLHCCHFILSVVLVVISSSAAISIVQTF